MKKNVYSLYRRLGVHQGRSGRVRKISPPPPGFDPRTVQSVASHYTDWAIPAHISLQGNKERKKERNKQTNKIVPNFVLRNVNLTFELRDLIPGVRYTDSRPTLTMTLGRRTWVGPRRGLDVVTERKFPYPVRNSVPTFTKLNYKFVISSFRRDVHEMCPLPGYYAALSGNLLPTFRDNVPVSSSRVR
jgi:hypothetical protein